MLTVLLLVFGLSDSGLTLVTFGQLKHKEATMKLMERSLKNIVINYVTYENMIE